jgi:hypothetical protein
MVTNCLKLEFNFVACYYFKYEFIRCEFFLKVNKLFQSIPYFYSVRKCSTYLFGSR